MRILVSIFSGVIFITLMIIIIQVIFKCTENPGGGVLDLSLGRGCHPDLETLTLFMINHGKLIPCL